MILAREKKKWTFTNTAKFANWNINSSDDMIKIEVDIWYETHTILPR